MLRLTGGALNMRVSLISRSTSTNASVFQRIAKSIDSTNIYFACLYTNASDAFLRVTTFRIESALGFFVLNGLASTRSIGE